MSHAHAYPCAITRAIWGLFFVAALGAEPATAGSARRDDPGSRYATIHSFDASGCSPTGGMMQAEDGRLYGALSDCGAHESGAIFAMDTSGTTTILHEFTGQADDSTLPISPPVQAGDGNLYGTAAGAGAIAGSVYRVTPSGDYSVVHVFAGSEGCDATAPLTVGPDGRLYGVLGGCSTFGRGAAFAMTLDGQVQVLHAFHGGREGKHPVTALALGPDGAFYGMTDSGGAHSDGTFFRMTAQGDLETLHALSPDACKEPDWRLTAVGDEFFGTCASSTAVQGSVYRVSSRGQFKVLHAFNGADGAHPGSGLAFDPATGDLYGTAFQGGSAGVGTVFRLSRNGAHFRVVHEFANDGVDGMYPLGDLLLASDGNVYGTASSGGTGGFGTAFRLKR